MERLADKFLLCPEGKQRYLKKISEVSFFLGLLMELTIVLLEKSEYIIQYEGWWFRLSFVLFGISMITYRYNLKEWLWFVLFAAVGGISYLVTGRNEILRAVVFVWACQGKDMKKVLKFTFWYTLAGCGVIMLLSVTGIYGELMQTAVYRSESSTEAVTRYCFGMGHPNSFHGMMLALSWLGLYCYHDKIKWYGYVLLGAAHVVIYLFTDSRTGLLMSAGTLFLTVTVQYWKKIQNSRLLYLFSAGTVAAAVIFSVLAAKYSVFHPFFAKIDGFLSGRIFALIDTMDSEGRLHTWSLWSRERNTYFFDLGIVRFFYWYGILPGILYFLAQCRLILCGYARKDPMLAVIMTVITVYSVFEAHFISEYLGRNYILFFFGLYLSDMLSIPEGKKGQG